MHSHIIKIVLFIEHLLCIKFRDGSQEVTVRCDPVLTTEKTYLALAGVTQWIERQPANQRVASSIPSQGTCLGFRLDPQWGVCKRQPHIDVSLSRTLPLCLKINK